MGGGKKASEERPRVPSAGSGAKRARGGGGGSFIMSAGGDFGNPLRKFKLVFLGEQSGESPPGPARIGSGLPQESGGGAGSSLPPRPPRRGGPTLVGAGVASEGIFPPSLHYSCVRGRLCRNPTL